MKDKFGPDNFEWADHIDPETERNFQEVGIEANSIAEKDHAPHLLDIRGLENKVVSQIRKTCHDWVKDCCSADPDKIRRIADFAGTVELDVKEVFESLGGGLIFLGEAYREVDKDD